MVEDAKDVAIQEADRIKAHAKEDIEQEAIRTRNELRAHVSVLVMQGVNSVLAKEVDAKAHQEMLNKLSQTL
jgi:F-type H+-transporting ATPase subunit b